MKTIWLSFLAAVVLHALPAQNDLAFTSAPPMQGNEFIGALASKPSILASAKTLNDEVLLSLGRGFSKPVNLLVFSPSAKVLINREIPAGQTRIRIDLNDLPDGTYTIRIVQGDFIWLQQVQKG